MGCSVIVGEGWFGVLVNVAVAGMDVGVAEPPKVGFGEAGKDVLVAWSVGETEVAGNRVFVGAAAGGIEVAVA